MSFTCARCSKPAPHGVKPEVIVGVHPHTHTAVGEHGETVVVGQGPQIHVELKLCPDCSGKPALAKLPQDFSALRVFASGFATVHARKCNGTTKVTRHGVKVEIPCQTCIDIQKTFASMPANGLTFALEDKLAAPFKPSLAFLCVGGLEAQSERSGKKAARDFAASYAVLRAYEQRGGSL